MNITAVTNTAPIAATKIVNIPDKTPSTKTTVIAPMRSASIKPTKKGVQDMHLHYH